MPFHAFHPRPRLCPGAGASIYVDRVVRTDAGSASDGIRLSAVVAVRRTEALKPYSTATRAGARAHHTHNLCSGKATNTDIHTALVIYERTRTNGRCVWFVARAGELVWSFTSLHERAAC